MFRFDQFNIEKVMYFFWGKDHLKVWDFEVLFKMHFLVSILGVVLISKENWPYWSRNLKHILIFNEFCKGICVMFRF